jgi:hypothetical protein
MWERYDNKYYELRRVHKMCFEILLRRGQLEYLACIGGYY